MKNEDDDSLIGKSENRVASNSLSRFNIFCRVNPRIPSLPAKPFFHLRPTWSTVFSGVIKVLRTAAYSTPQNVQSVRLLTDHSIPLWTPTLPKGVSVLPSDEPAGEWYFPSHITENVKDFRGLYIFFLHGGAFCCCNTTTHRGILFRVVDSTKSVIFAVDYRRPPEHPYPSPLDDCLKAYEWMLTFVEPRRIIFMGDSAGGGLVVSTICKAADKGFPLPCAAVLLSPWVNLEDFSSNSWERNMEYDYVPKRLAELFSASYLGEISSQEVSPTFLTNLNVLPPTLIECGECEVLIDQIIEFANKCKSLGIECELNVSDDMVHVFQLFAFTGMRQCSDSFDRITEFCARFSNFP